MKLVISETVNDIPVVTEKENTILIADFDAGAGAVPLTTVTGKGSLIVGTANATVDELVVGTNGQVPIADSGETAGIRWGSPAGSFVASDAENRTLSATLVLTDADAYVQYCDPGGANRDITLPAEGTGNHAFWIYNAADAAETLTIKNDATTVIATLTRGQSALLVSSDTTWTALYTAPIETHTWGGTISNPQAVYAQRAILPVGYTSTASTIASIIVRVNTATPGAELAADLKFADDIFTASLANATLVNALDTTSGALTKTSAFTDATIPASKFVYIQFDSSPHADIVDIFVDIKYTED